MQSGSGVGIAIAFTAGLLSFLSPCVLPLVLMGVGAVQGAKAQSTSPVSERGDAVVLEMAQAFKRNDRKRLTALLPQARGHLLEPWAAYWELRARLDEASSADIRQFLQRYAGTYQEDRLRNEWLLQLGRRRDWPAFLAEVPQFRMNDDNSVRCYTLMAESATRETDVSAQVQALWLAQREAERAADALRRFADDVDRENSDLTSTLADLTGTVEARRDADLQHIETERQIRERAINDDDMIDAAKRQQLVELNNQNADARKQLARQRAEEEIRDRQIRADQVRSQLSIELIIV